MRSFSLLRLILFSLALYANVQYAAFLLNPAHIGHPVLYAFALTADLLSIIFLSFSWISCLAFEFFAHRYYWEIDTLQAQGKSFVKKKTAVLVPVTSTNPDIVRNTLTHVLAMEGNTRVYVLDDGGTDAIKALCEELGVSYMKRHDRKHFKSGNLNFGLESIKEEFVAVFDEDFMPKKSFLRETLPFFVDTTVGAVQTPQIYYNTDTVFAAGSQNFQHIFYRYILPIKHLMHSAFSVGTNVVFRKAALDAIGGFVKIDHSEDIFTSIKLLEHKYRIAYLNRELAVGLAPTNVLSFFNQQYRWARGGLAMLFRHNTLFNKRLNYDQRVQFFFSNMFYLTGLAMGIYLLMPFLVILIQDFPIRPGALSEWLIKFISLVFFNQLFYVFLIRKNRLSTLILGLFTSIPFMMALASVILNVRFLWKPTNTASKGLVTKILAPLIVYVVVSIIILLLFAIGALTLPSQFSANIGWMGVNAFFMFYLIIASYQSLLKQ